MNTTSSVSRLRLTTTTIIPLHNIPQPLIRILQILKSTFYVNKIKYKSKPFLYHTFTVKKTTQPRVPLGWARSLMNQVQTFI